MSQQPKETTMADPTQTPEETPHFETSDVDANRAIEQGLGVSSDRAAGRNLVVVALAHACSVLSL